MIVIEINMYYYVIYQLNSFYEKSIQILELGAYKNIENLQRRLLECLGDLSNNLWKMQGPIDILEAAVHRSHHVWKTCQSRIQQIPVFFPSRHRRISIQDHRIMK